MKKKIEGGSGFNILLMFFCCSSLISVSRAVEPPAVAADVLFTQPVVFPDWLLLRQQQPCERLLFFLMFCFCWSHEEQQSPPKMHRPIRSGGGEEPHEELTESEGGCVITLQKIMGSLEPEV